ncbi:MULTISPECIES: hypothetical protein [unclassified Nonomuraea]
MAGIAREKTWDAVHRGWPAALALPPLVLLAAHRDLRRSGR